MQTIATRLSVFLFTNDKLPINSYLYLGKDSCLSRHQSHPYRLLSHKRFNLSQPRLHLPSTFCFRFISVQLFKPSSYYPVRGRPRRFDKLRKATLLNVEESTRCDWLRAEGKRQDNQQPSEIFLRWWVWLGVVYLGCIARVSQSKACACLMLMLLVLN